MLDTSPFDSWSCSVPLRRWTEGFLGRLARVVGLSNALPGWFPLPPAQIRRLDTEGDGRDTLHASIRPGGIRPGLAGTAEGQAA